MGDDTRVPYTGSDFASVTIELRPPASRGEAWAEYIDDGDAMLRVPSSRRAPTSSSPRPGRASSASEQ